MQSQISLTKQSEASVSLPGFFTNVTNLESAYGIGETPLENLLATRLTPTSRTRKPSNKLRKFSGWCRWCSAAIPISSTKPRKDCGNSCTQQFKRHGCSKEVWLLLRDIEKAAKAQDHDREVELRRAAAGLLCRTPRSRSEFDAVRNYHQQTISPNLPKTGSTPEIEEAAKTHQEALFTWMRLVAEPKFVEGARPKPKEKSKTHEQARALAKRRLEEAYEPLHLLLERQSLLKDQYSTVKSRIAPDQLNVTDRPTVFEPTPLSLTRGRVTRKIGNKARVKTNSCAKCRDYMNQNHEHGLK